MIIPLFVESASWNVKRNLNTSCAYLQLSFLPEAEIKFFPRWFDPKLSMSISKEINDAGTEDIIFFQLSLNICMVGNKAEF